jgi:hypothetical protein
MLSKDTQGQSSERWETALDRVSERVAGHGQSANLERRGVAEKDLPR